MNAAAPRWQLTIDANDPGRLVEFWAPLLGYVKQPAPDGFATWNDWYRSVGVPDDELDADSDGCDRLCDPTGEGPPIWFQIVPETKSGLKNRLHLDVLVGGGRGVPIDERIARVEAKVADAVAAGGLVVRRPSAEPDDGHYAVLMSDPEGNEFCIV